MDGKAVGKRTVELQQALVDMVELLAKAVLSGVGVAVLMAVAILLLSSGAQAQTVGLNDAKAGELLFRAAEAGRYTVAPKVSTEVAIEVHGMVARTRLTQVFHNPAAEFVEGVYVFPLPEKAAVDRLWVRIGERVIEGQVREKAEARRTYEKARAEGRKAALVEQQRPNLFTNAVAHIGPDERIVVRIEYQQSLAYDDGRYRLRVPMAVSPRYVGVGAAMPDEPKAAEAIEELHGVSLAMPMHVQSSAGTLVNPVDIAVLVDAGVPIAELASSYHEMRFEKRSGSQALALLAKDQVEMDRDFELTWRVAGAAPQAAIFVQRKTAAEYALLMVVPPRPDAAESGQHQRLPRETILIVDTSGSMQGAPLAQAKLALEHALGTLRPGDRFNVLEFNSTTHALFPDALPATPKNVEDARAWVRNLQARGGTEMGPALARALDGADTPGYLRQVVFMTDGAVGNEEALFRLITTRLGSSRLFTVGIGSAPNGHFMAKAAQFGRGSFTHIGDLREVQQKMVELFAKIEAPVLRDVAIRWADGTPVETFPARVPDLYLGEPVLVAASAAKLSTVVVSGMRGNQPWSVALTPAGGSDAAGVGALWAREKIASLMDEMTRGAEPGEIRAQVVKVALEHHLVSAYTSLVAVDVTPTAPAAEPRAALVGASLPHGWAAGTQLPQTDTPATLRLLSGMATLLLAALLAAGARRARRIA